MPRGWRRIVPVQGPHAIIAARLGFRPDTTRLAPRARRNTGAPARLAERSAESEAVVVGTARGERGVEDGPLRVQVIGDEEVTEKVGIAPRDTGAGPGASGVGREVPAIDAGVRLGS